MNGLLSVLLLVSIYSIQAVRADHGNGSCEQMEGRCVPSTNNCKSINANCPTGETCCAAKPTTGENRKKRNSKDSKRRCKKTPKKCKRKGGVCTHKDDECTELIDEDLCKGASCRCCKSGNNCKIKKKCTKKGGYCVTDSNDCQGSLGKGCKGKGCKCCVPTVKCGIETSASSRIVNGVDVSVARKYSWQVGLKASKEVSDQYYCGGSIITNKHILTAAHCFTERFTCAENIPDEVYVGIGDHNQAETTDNLPDFVDPILVKKIMINPDFDCETMNMDVAVLELSKSIDLEKNADVLHPICLPKDDGETYAGETATVTGWGSIDAVEPGDTNPPITIPNVLQEVELPVVDNSDCSQDFTEYMVCTGTTGGKDACVGDSGGPVSIEENGQFVQIGIVSFGSGGCGAEGQFGGHARVNKFVDWIKEQVGSETTYTLP